MLNTFPTKTLYLMSVNMLHWVLCASFGDEICSFQLFADAYCNNTISSLLCHILPLVQTPSLAFCMPSSRMVHFVQPWLLYYIRFRLDLYWILLYSSPGENFCISAAKHIFYKYTIQYNKIAGHITFKNFNNKGNENVNKESVYSVSKV